ncbi:hypothetical protein EMCRGX_G017094 [Ephydatia muelleri]
MNTSSDLGRGEEMVRDPGPLKHHTSTEISLSRDRFLKTRTEPVPSRLTTTPAGTTPPSGAHGASHPQVLGPRLWWRALCQGLAMCCTSGPVISMSSHHSTTSELIPLYNERAHTALRTASSHDSTTRELTRLYDQRAHTTLQPASSYHSTTSELTSLNDQRAHITLRPVSSHHSMTSGTHTTL